jgi:hypothetical protein
MAKSRRRRPRVKKTPACCPLPRGCDHRGDNVAACRLLPDRGDGHSRRRGVQEHRPRQKGADVLLESPCASVRCPEQPHHRGVGGEGPACHGLSPSCGRFARRVPPDGMGGFLRRASLDARRGSGWTCGIAPRSPTPPRGRDTMMKLRTGLIRFSSLRTFSDGASDRTRQDERPDRRGGDLNSPSQVLISSPRSRDCRSLRSAF